MECLELEVRALPSVGVLLDSLVLGTLSVALHACLLKSMLGGLELILQRGDGTFPAVQLLPGNELPLHLLHHR
jgi:hypothetical protein